LTAYAHNRVLFVKEGETVAQGQKIAEVGDTDTNRVMLHFELRYQGRSIDPSRALPPR
jgi:murein DD-endopeptidase MepM/ murein hydrolase activator NlpD